MCRDLYYKHMDFSWGEYNGLSTEKSEIFLIFVITNIVYIIPIYNYMCDIANI